MRSSLACFAAAPSKQAAVGEVFLRKLASLARRIRTLACPRLFSRQSSTKHVPLLSPELHAVEAGRSLAR
jgi:hypothetical protein